LSDKVLLFADDSGTMRLVMEKTFQAEPIQVVAVPSGEAAIASARERRPDIIIVDAGMPGINGYDVCETLRQDAAFADLPIVLMHGISTPYDEVRGRKVGATAETKKPFDTTKLIEQVFELIAAAPAAKPAPAVQPAPPPQAAPAPPPLPFSAPAASVADAAPTPPPAPTPPAAPLRPAPPSSPSGMYSAASLRAPAPPASPATPRGTMDFARPAETTPEPEPIELQEDLSADADFKVGSLAELAQMSSDGNAVAQEYREDAIELDTSLEAPQYGRSAPLPEPVAEPAATEPATASPTESAVAATRAEARDLAAQAIAAVPGLTPDQASAILQLTEDVVEKVVWEVVPDLAETMIREKLDRLLRE